MITISLYILRKAYRLTLKESGYAIFIGGIIFDVFIFYALIHNENYYYCCKW